MILARTGELRQLGSAIKDDDATLVAFINLGLIEIYKRFVLKTDEAVLNLVDGKTIYKLDGTDPNVTLGNDPFMYLISAYGQDVNATDYTPEDTIILPINVEDDINSINTITYNEVQIPLVTTGALISLIYASTPTKVTLDNLDQDLDIPDVFVEALLNYMGYRGHTSINETGQSEDDLYYMKFEKSCNKVRELGVGVAPDDMSMNGRLSNRGFI